MVDARSGVTAAKAVWLTDASAMMITPATSKRDASVDFFIGDSSWKRGKNFAGLNADYTRLATECLAANDRLGERRHDGEVSEQRVDQVRASESGSLREWVRKI